MMRKIRRPVEGVNKYYWQRELEDQFWSGFRDGVITIIAVALICWGIYKMVSL